MSEHQATEYAMKLAAEEHLAGVEPGQRVQYDLHDGYGKRHGVIGCVAEHPSNAPMDVIWFTSGDWCYRFQVTA